MEFSAYQRAASPGGRSAASLAGDILHVRLVLVLRGSAEPSRKIPLAGTSGSRMGAAVGARLVICRGGRRCARRVGPSQGHEQYLKVNVSCRTQVSVVVNRYSDPSGRRVISGE